MKGIKRLAVVGSAIAALAVGAGNASALDVQSSSGSPGWVSALTDGAATESSDVFGASTIQAGVGFMSLSLWASPASSQTQVVTVTMSVWGEYLLKLYNQGSSTRSWYVYPGRWNNVVVNAAGSPLVVFGPNANVFYFAQATVTWKTLSGAYLGSKVINYRSLGDLQCLTNGCAYHNGGSLADSGYMFSPSFFKF
jgi:hypothetical protein